MASIINATTTNGVAVQGDNSGSLQLQTNNGTTAVTIDTSQNVGVGTTSPATKFHVSGQARIADSSDSANRITIGVGSNAPYGNASISTTTAGLAIVAEGNGNMTFNNNGSERMRITSGGDLLVNTSSASGYGTAKLAVFSSLASAYGGIFQDTGTTYGTSSEYIVFTNSSGARAGSIQHTAVTTVAYNTSSDARLKEDLGIATDTSVIDNTIIHNFKWIANQADDVGVFAQEAHLVKPSAVSVGSDDLTEDGNLKQPWGVDYSKYVPDLIVYCQQLKKSIQELKAELDATKAEVQALKGVA